MRVSLLGTTRSDLSSFVISTHRSRNILYSLSLRTRDCFMRILLGLLNCRCTLFIVRYIRLNYTFFRIRTHFYGIPRLTRSNAIPLNADDLNDDDSKSDRKINRLLLLMCYLRCKSMLSIILR